MSNHFAVQRKIMIAIACALLSACAAPTFTPGAAIPSPPGWSDYCIRTPSDPACK